MSKSTSATPVFSSWQTGESNACREWAPIVSPFVQSLCLTLAVLSLLILAVVESDGKFAKGLALRIVAQTAILALCNLVAYRFRQSIKNPASIVPFLTAFPMLVVVWEVVLRVNSWGGRSSEMVLMHFLAAMVCGLGAVCLWKKFHSICVAMSLFLVTFAMTVSQQPLSVFLVGSYTVVAIAWSMAVYWERLGSEVVREFRPRRGISLLLLLVAILGIFIFSERKNEMLGRINGFSPASGGLGDRSEFARNGIGTGEILIAGCENIQSIGPIDDAPFSTDDTPSLYDIFDEAYSEPFIRKKTDRAVALDPADVRPNRSKDNHVHHQTQKVNQEFSTLRKPPPNLQGKVDSIESDALFYVAGRTPLHLRLEHFDRFDGVVWHADSQGFSSAETTLQMVKQKGRDWLKLPDHQPTKHYLGEAETHAIKVVHLDTNVIPAPAFLHGVHIDRIDRLDMFGYSPLGMVRMNREKLAELVPIHLASRCVDYRELFRENNAFINAGSLKDIPEGLAEPCRRIAKSWVGDKAVGWGQIQAVVQQLRSKYVHDRSWSAKPDFEFPVMEFLTDTKRGPDYQFATAAALLLRSLGYSARVVGGFYASPEKYDMKSMHTPVHQSDVHFWIEICLNDNEWIPLDPTPGYETLVPRFDFIKCVKRMASSALIIAQENVSFVGMGLALAGGLWWQRRRLWDHYAMTLWRIFPRHHTALRAWRILRNRIGFDGLAASKSVTPQQFLKWVGRQSPPEALLLPPFSDMLNEEAFSCCKSGTRDQDASIRLTTILKRLKPSMCRRLAKQWNLQCRQFNSNHS